MNNSKTKLRSIFEFLGLGPSMKRVFSTSIRLCLSLILFGGLFWGCRSNGEPELSDSVDSYIEAYFNSPGANRHTIDNPSFDERMIRLIDLAQQKIHFSFYGFTHRGIADAVIRAVERGLEVEFTGDHTHYTSGDYGYMEFERRLGFYPRARLTVGNSQSIMHNKWMIIDDLYVMTGTGNITNSGLTQNDNAWVIIRDRELAADFEREHQQMITGRFGHAKLRTDTKNVFTVGGNLVENYFSPQEDGMARYIQTVDESKRNVFFMIFAFTHDDLGRSLIARHKQFVRETGRGFQVGTDGVPPLGLQGIMDRSQFTHAQYIEVYRLAGACGDVNPEISIADPVCDFPIDFRRDGNENTAVPGDWQGGGGRLHSKIILIDVGTPKAKVLVGSFNWSDNASENNDENLVIIHSQGIADRFYQKYTDLYAIARDLPGKEATYNEVVISEVNWAGSRVNIPKMTREGMRKAYYDYDGNEFVELYNPSDQPIDISYWSLRFPINEMYTDPGINISGFPSWEAARKKAFMGFPEGTKIPPKGFFVIYEPDLRNDNKNGYDFTASELYLADNPNTFANNVAVYNPYNGLSNFMGLYDRRDSRTYRSLIFVPNFTISYPDWEEYCRPAWSSHIQRFTSSQNWNIHRVNANGPFPFKLGLRIELRDSSGNLVDVAGDGRLGPGLDTCNEMGMMCNDRLRRGGFFTTGMPAKDADPGEVNGGSWPPPNYTCGVDDNIHLISMERKQPDANGWGHGDEWESWENAAKQTGDLADRRKYLRADFAERTVATPGRPNSRWTTEEP